MSFVKRRPLVEIHVSDINCCRTKTKDGVDSPQNDKMRKMMKRLYIWFLLCRRKRNPDKQGTEESRSN